MKYTDETESVVTSSTEMVKDSWGQQHLQSWKVGLEDIIAVFLNQYKFVRGISQNFYRINGILFTCVFSNWPLLEILPLWHPLHIVRYRLIEETNRTWAHVCVFVSLKNLVFVFGYDTGQVIY